MRRNLFGRSPEVERLTPARISANEAMTFDVRDHEASTDHTLIERRVGSWSLTPWFILAGHLILSVGLLMQNRPAGSSAALSSVLVFALFRLPMARRFTAFRCPQIVQIADSSF